MSSKVGRVTTPASRFQSLPEFPYQPSFFNFSKHDLRLAYIDEKTPNYSPEKSETFLCLHGVPTWSFLYRKMIPVFLKSNDAHKRGVRVICPDFIGWGRSDKPTDREFHNVYFHRNSLLALAKELDLRNITVVCQDWGGLIGLTLPLDEDFRSRMSRVIMFNTGISAGTPPGPGFMSWRNYVQRNPDMMVGGLITTATNRTLTKEELRGYDAPFPDVKYKAAISAWPMMVPISPDYPGMDLWAQAYLFWGRNKQENKRKAGSGIQVFIAHGMKDIVFTANSARQMYQLMIGGDTDRCPGLCWVPHGHHFLQEYGDFVAEKALKYFGDIPLDLVEYDFVNYKSSKKADANDDRLAVKIMLNNPPAHPQTHALLNRLGYILKTLEENPDAGGYIICANNEKKNIFSAGYDINAFLRRDKKELIPYFIRIGEVRKQMLSSKKPFIACMNGHALAGGMVLAAQCDYRICKKNVKIGLTESAIGILVGLDTVNTIIPLTGAKNARYIFTTGQIFNGERAQELGLVDRCVDTENDQLLFDTCVEVMEKEYFNGKPEAVAHCRRLFNEKALEGVFEDAEARAEKMYQVFTSKVVQDTFRRFMNRKRSKM